MSKSQTMPKPTLQADRQDLVAKLRLATHCFAGSRFHQLTRSYWEGIGGRASRALRSQAEPGNENQIARGWIAILVLTLTFNCGCVAEKESLHEMDHELPSHWPLNMEDAAQKIQQRLGLIEIKESPAATREELSDLIEWAPEVAADTDLAELEWMPIYELSETLRHHLSAKDISLDDCRDDIERFIVLLRESHAKLPNPNSAEDVKQ